MPKVFITSEQREINRFNDYVRGELRRRNLRHADLADELNLPQVSVTNRLNGKTEWTLADIVSTLSYLGTAYSFGAEK